MQHAPAGLMAASRMVYLASSLLLRFSTAMRVVTFPARVTACVWLIVERYRWEGGHLFRGIIRLYESRNKDVVKELPCFAQVRGGPHTENLRNALNFL